MSGKLLNTKLKYQIAYDSGSKGYPLYDPSLFLVFDIPPSDQFIPFASDNAFSNQLVKLYVQSQLSQHSSEPLNRICLNLMGKPVRAWFINIILNSWRCHIDPIRMPCNMMIGDVPYSAHELSMNHVYLQLIAMEFLQNSHRNKLILTLHALRARPDVDHIDFLQSITSNRLVLRHVFGMRNTTLSEAVLSLILYIAVSHPIAMTKTDCFMSSEPVGTYFGRHVGRTTFPRHLQPVFATLRYWKRSHFIFAANNGLSRLLVDLYWQHKHAQPAPPGTRSIFDGLCYPYFGYADKRDRKGAKGLVQYVRDSFTKLVPGEKVQLLYSHLVGVDSSPVPTDHKCGWPPCDKWKGGRHRFPARSICKGCRLIRYCSRIHQKRHWKYMHSQQCGGIINHF